MEMDDLHTPKRSRLHFANRATGVRWVCGPPASAVKVGDESHNQRDDVKNREDAGKTEEGVRHWHQHASRICRVSRGSGGKDRHSKVLTAKGLRDRRVRLSVSTAIQFYDLQDRLGVDQPSKAVEWLIKAASAAINELPALDGPFPDHFDQLIVEEKPGTRQKENDAVNEMEDDADDGEWNDEKELQQQNLSLSKFACSGTSMTSKGSVSSLLQTEYCVKTKDRAKGKNCAKKKDKGDGDEVRHHLNLHSHDAQSSFTVLLSGNIGNAHDHDSVTLAQLHTGVSANVGSGLFSKQFRHVPVASATTDYFFQSGSFGQGEKPQQPSGLPAQAHLGSISSIGINAAAAIATAGDHPEMQQQQFSFLQDHLIPVTAVAARGEYSLNFSISSGLAGFDRGTLQSNSQSMMSHNHHLQRLSSAEDGSNLPFFLTAPTPTAPASGVNHFPAGYDSRLQLCYGDEYQNADLKRKEKG